MCNFESDALPVLNFIKDVFKEHGICIYSMATAYYFNSICPNHHMLLYHCSVDGDVAGCSHSLTIHH